MPNYWRRTTGIVACFAPVALLAGSLIAGIIRPRERALGFTVIGLGLLVAGLNLHLCAVRPVLYRWRRGSFEGMRRISGLPLIGTILVVCGGVAGFGDWRAAVLGLIALAADTGGLPWFLLATWRDKSFWDG